MGRRWGTKLGAIVLALTLAMGAAGCLTAELDAPALRVPLLFGPVPCIGCGDSGRAPTGAPVAHIEARPRGYRATAPRSGITIGSTRPETDANRVLASTPCHDNLQLANIRARARGLALPVINIAVFERTVEGDAMQVSTAGVSCLPP